MASFSHDIQRLRYIRPQNHQGVCPDSLPYLRGEKRGCLPHLRPPVQLWALPAIQGMAGRDLDGVQAGLREDHHQGIRQGSGEGEVYRGSEGGLQPDHEESSIIRVLATKVIALLDYVIDILNTMHELRERRHDPVCWRISLKTGEIEARRGWLCC